MSSRIIWTTRIVLEPRNQSGGRDQQHRKIINNKKNYLTVNMSDTVEIPRNCKRLVRMVPQNFTLNEKRDLVAIQKSNDFDENDDDTHIVFSPD